MKISMISENEVFTGIFLRELKLECEESHIEISHFQYCNWPDHGIPNVEEFHNFICFIKEIRSADDLSPMIVHCRLVPDLSLLTISAGVGRTGTFCVVNSLSEAISHGCLSEWTTEDPDPIFETISLFREQRNRLIVQTPVSNQDQVKVCRISWNLSTNI